MKYGKNQWGRIASLLVKKSPKQCKARWYEWLDPSIKKTEWTREEDEKLLHLAKLMPQQWRSIAPIVGRTAHQCLERYEKLIDNASAQQQDASSSDQQQQQQSNPRKLKPGEIDPAPETKPAKPDAVDMDEDEKEMLNEARARLANTQGKKAKRKARERQLEEARRLANLQKKRELKAAGLEGAINRRKHRGGIDYGVEIPFKKDPPKGFFDTTEEELREKEKSQGEFKPTTIQELEGVKRKDIEKSVMESKTKQQEMQERNDAPAAIAQAEQANDVDMSQRRGKLTLPAPQVSEREMNDIAKLGKRGGIYGSSDASASDSTAGLVANYSASETPAATTPRTPKEERDTVLQEAENLSKLQSGETPLAGGENPDLHPSDFSGVTPRRSHPRTPNANASQGTVQQTPGETPRSAASSPASQRGSQQGRTPFRDSFGINAPDSQALLGSKCVTTCLYPTLLSSV
jgi:pre-mRNA-splicing factor CDC5/CEF1